MRNVILFFIIIPQLAIGQIILNKTEANKLKNNILNTSSSTKHLKSEFVQYKHLSFLENEIVSEGNLTYISPNYIKWQYSYPFNLEYIFADEKIIINNEGEKNEIDIGSNPLFKELNKIIISTLKGDMFDEEKFTIKYYDNTLNYKIKFIVKEINLSKYFSAFELLFKKETYDVIEIKINEDQNDFTKIKLFNKKINNDTN